MKQFALVIAILFAITSGTSAVTLTWDADPGWAEEGVLGVHVYWEDDVTGVVNNVDVAQPDNSTTVLDAQFLLGTNYNFWATAFTDTEESDDSNIVSAYYNTDGVWELDQQYPPNDGGRNHGKSSVGCFIDTVR